MEGRHIKRKWLVDEPYRKKTIKIEVKRKCASLIFYTKIHIHSHNYTHTHTHTCFLWSRSGTRSHTPLDDTLDGRSVDTGSGQPVESALSYTNYTSSPGIS